MSFQKKDLIIHTDIIDAYKNILGREPDTTGYKKYFEEKKKRGDFNIALDLKESREYQQYSELQFMHDKINLVYQTVLRRPVDECGLRTYSNKLKINPDFSIQDELKKSLEYQNLSKNTEIYEYINSVADTLEYKHNKNMNILYIAWFGTSGYAKVAGDIMKCLETFANITFEIMNVYNCNKSFVDESHDILKFCKTRLKNYDCIILHSVPDEWEKYVTKLRQKYTNTKILGITVWETSDLPKSWAKCINQVDAISVPCMWNEHVFKKSVRVCVDTVFHPILKCTLKPKPIQSVLKKLYNYNYVFYTINEFNNRKSIKELVSVFSETFGNDKNVALYIKTSGDVAEHIGREFILQTNCSNIIIDYTRYSDEEICWIHKFCSCYISLTKAEGTGLSIVEAGIYDKPIIVTNYSGHLEYIRYASYVDYKLIPANYCSKLHHGHEECSKNGFCKRNKWYDDSHQQWAMPDLKSASEIMQYHYQKKIKQLGGNKDYIDSVFNLYSCASEFKKWILKHIEYSSLYLEGHTKTIF